MTIRPITVKMLCRSLRSDSRGPLARQLLDGWAEAHNMQFVFDPEARDYDWLVVYENLPAKNGERRPMRIERLSCPPQNTILLTTEPSAIKIYGSAYIRQFGHVVTSQEPFALKHPGRIWSQAGLLWFYGQSRNDTLSADEIRIRDPEKTEVISTVCSTKRHGHTLHRLRYDFTFQAARNIPEIQVYGHGHRPIDDKAEALDAFKYHLAIENHLAPHHFTEKLADAFLGLALPFYFGAPNAADYFPSESFIPIDIRRPIEAIRTMKMAMENNEYEKRLPAIREARRRVLEEHSLFPLVGRVIGQASPAAQQNQGSGAVLMSQRAARKSRPLLSAADFAFREALHLKNRIAGLLS